MTQYLVSALFPALLAGLAILSISMVIVLAFSSRPKRSDTQTPRDREFPT